MKPLPAAQLLDVWERGRNGSSVERALFLLTAACPDIEPDALARLSIGRRDGLLLTLREWTFGDPLVALVDCPECGEHVETVFRTADVRTAPTQDETVLALTAGECEVRFRLPDSLDLLAIPVGANLDTARRVLLERCVIAVRRGGEAEVAAELPEPVAAAVAVRMAEADPQADVQIELACPACQHTVQVAFDVTAFFWTE